MTQQLQAPTLRDGDRMTRPEFHALYEAYRGQDKFELIKGVVTMAAAQRLFHGEDEPELGAILAVYKSQTPGVRVAHNSTVILDDESEPQPDYLLRVTPEYRGQAGVSPDGYLVGAPELVAEVSHASRWTDLNPKFDMYREAHTAEYLVLLVAERRLRWFDFRNGGELAPDESGVWRSRAFPGLWVDAPAVLSGRTLDAIATLGRGLASPEHAAFVARLAAARAGS